MLVEPDRHRRHVHEQGRGVEADHLDHTWRHAEGGRQGGAPARRRRQRHRRQDGSRGFPGGRAGDAGHEVPPGLDGDPHAHDSVLQLQEQGSSASTTPCRSGSREYPNADKVTLRMLSSVTSGYPDYIQENPPFQARHSRSRSATGRTTSCRIRVRAADRLRPGRMLPLRAHQLHHPRQGCREDHREIDHRALAAEVPRSARAHRNEYHEAPGHPFTRTPRVHVGARCLRGVDWMEPIVGPRRRTHHDVDAARHDHAHQGGRHRQAALEGVSERAGRGSVEGPAGCAWADRLRTWGRRRQWVGVAEPGLQRIRGDCRVPAVAATLDRDRQHARPERRGGHEHRHRHLQGTRCVPGPNFTLNSQGSLIIGSQL